MTHYYDSKGNPAYEIIGKNGKARAPYVKEARDLGLVPGVTSISGQVGNENIINWMIYSAIDICMEHPFCEMGTSKEDWKKKISQLIKIEKERITGQGHKIHDALEHYYKSGKIKEQYRDFIVPVIELIENKWPMLQRTDWIPERSFNFGGLYGGKVDISTEYNGGIILDFKTKDSEDINKFKAYESHKQQLIAYGYGLKMPKAQYGNIFLSALKPNILLLEMHGDLTYYWNKFKLLLQYWHLDKYEQYVEIQDDSLLCCA